MTETLGPQQAAVDDRSTWYRILRKVGLVYIFSRLCVLAGAAIVAVELQADINQSKGIPNVPFPDPHIAGRPLPSSALAPISDVLASWDGIWYLRIVRQGYPRHVQDHVTYFVSDARAAFFPAYPLLVRGVDKVLPGGDTVAALFCNFVLGAIAIFLLGVMAKQLYGEQVAAKAMVLGAMFPGSFVLSFAYTEALLLVFAMGCLWCLMSKRWILAGVLAAFGTATRPNGLALVLACAVAAFLAIRDERDWRSLAAPILAPGGFIAFQLWLGNHTGEAGVWFRVQAEAWGEGASYGLTAVRKTFEAFAHPLTSSTNVITAASVMTMLLMIYFLWVRRLPLPMVAYSAGILVLMLLPNTVTARPRFLYTAFPLFISAAAYLHEDRRDWWPYVIGACSAGLVTLTALYGVFGGNSVTWRRYMSGQWLGVWALGLLAYVPALLAAPGKMPSDTKLYLYLDPGRLISDAPYTWDNRQFAGWVPHQTVTYLWPAGPWYWVFEQLHVPDWIAHRLWIATLLFVGGLGVRWAARHLGLPGAGALTAAFVYQLSPYILPYLSRTSLMLLPWAGVGWLVGLTIRSATRTRWRDPAIFALVIFTVGSPNATALMMIAPAPVLWLLHAAWQQSITWRRAVAAGLRIGGLCLGVSLWWIAMLVVQSRHGADVLSYSETLEAVSFTSVSTETLRGLGYWLFYIRDPAGFATSASASYLESGRIIAIGFALLICCVAGIALTRWSQRRYAAMLVFVGVVLAVGVHPIADPSPLMSRLANESRSSLSLAIRSSTRALPLSNFGLALGAGAFATAASALIIKRRPRLRLLAPSIVIWLAVLNLPALFNGGFVDPALVRDETVPAAWQQAAAALDDGSTEHRVMQLPGAEFGAFRWGYTVDPPLPGLTAKPLITRDLLPLGSPGAMDLLYALDDRAQANVVDPSSIAPVARFFGADTIWISNDMAFERFRTPRPELTYAMFNIPPNGLAEPQPFGTATSNEPTLATLDETALANPTIGEPVPPVELADVQQPVAMVRAASRVVVLAGSGDGIVDASAAGLLHGDEAILYAADLGPDDQLDDADQVIVTDSNRDRAHQWRGTQDVVGFTETGGPQSDVLLPDTADQRLPVFTDQSAVHQTTAAVDGLEIRATGYGEPFAYRPEDRPAMAVDGDPATAWAVADRFNPIGQRIEVSGDLTNLSLLQSQQSGASRMISSVRLDFDNGSSGVVELDDRSLTGSGQPMDVPAGATFVAITITAIAPRPGATDPGPSAVGFAELGLGAHTEVVSLPGDTTGISPTTPLAIVLTRLRTDPLNRWRSDPEPRTIRAFALASNRDLAATFTLHRNDRASDEVLNRLAGVETATSNRRLTGDPGSTAAHAIDGNPTTAWTSPFSDVVGSTLSIPLVATEATSSLELTQRLDESHSVITRVTVTLGDAVSTVDVPAPDANGRSTITFPAANAAQMSLAIADIAPRTTVDRRYAETTVLPVAITELATPSIAAPRPAATQAECRGDLVEIDGVPVPISVDLQTISSLLSGDAVDVQPCDAPSIALASGPHRLTTAAGSTTGIDVDRIVLSDARADAIATAPNPPTVSVDRTRTTRTATVTNCPTGCWLILGEGYNDGWKATVAGLDLGAPRQISGGFNGWRLPASDAPVTVTMTWTPQRTMWIGMALAALSVVACAVLIWRDKAKTDVRVPAAPVMDWPSVPVGRRRSLIAAGTMVVAAGLVISPKYAVVAAVVGLAVVVLRRTLVAGLAALALIASLAALILRRQIRYRLAANPSWPAAFDDLHRFGLLVVVLLLACTIVDDCPRDQPEEVA